MKNKKIPTHPFTKKNFVGMFKTMFLPEHRAFTLWFLITNGLTCILLIINKFI